MILRGREEDGLDSWVRSSSRLVRSSNTFTTAKPEGGGERGRREGGGDGG